MLFLKKIKKTIIIFLILSCNTYKSNKVLKLENTIKEYHNFDNVFYSYLKNYKNTIINNIELREETGIIVHSIYILYKRLELKIYELINSKVVKNTNIKNNPFYYDIINKFKYFFILNTVNYFNEIIPFRYTGKTFKKYNPLTCFRMLLKWFKLKIRNYNDKWPKKNIKKYHDKIIYFASYLSNGIYVYNRNKTFGDTIINKVSINNFTKCKKLQRINNNTLLEKITDKKLYPIITYYFSEQGFLQNNINNCFKSIKLKPINFKITDFKSIYIEKKQFLNDDKKMEFHDNIRIFSIHS